MGDISLIGSSDQAPLGTTAGAVETVVANPTNANILYVGTPEGGIWKTIDGGATWTPLTDNQAAQSIATLALDPTDPTNQTLIAGTGLTANGYVGSVSALQQSGGLTTGLLYSQDGGQTWTDLGAAALSGQTVDAVAARGNVILAGTYEMSLYASPQQKTAGGLYRSTDGGSTFTLVPGTNGLPAGPISSIAGDPANPNTLYAAVASPSLTPAGEASTGVYMSTDNGATWSPVFGAAQSGGAINNSTQTAIKVATGPDGSVAAGVINIQTGKLTGLFLSENAGASWTSLPVPNVNVGSQAPVNFAIAIDPTNPNLVYVSGDRIAVPPYSATVFRVDATTMTATSMTDRSATPKFTGNGSTIHADTRQITFNASGQMIVVSDGGVYARTQPQSTSGVWEGLNGNLSVYEIYGLAYDANSKRLIVSAQDTGSSMQSAPGAILYNQIGGGDGINAQVNDVTYGGESLIYTSCQFLSCLTRTVVDSNGDPFGPTPSLSVQFNQPVVGANQNFISPFVLNRIDPTRIALAGTDVYVTQDTTSISTAHIRVTLNLTDLGSAGGNVTKLAYGTRDNPNVVLAGASAGQLWLSTTATAGSLGQLPAYSGLTPTSLVFDPRSQNRFYVADSQQLWGTTNQGAQFENLTPDLPSTFIRPTSTEFISNNGVNALLVGGLNTVANVGNPIVVATSSTAGVLSDFSYFGQGIPNVLVSTMTYNPAVDVLGVGTFGRGAYVLYDVTSYFPQATVLQFGLANNDSAPDASLLTGNRPLIKYGTGTLTIAGDATYTGGTTIDAGILQIGNGGTSGSIPGDVLDNGTLAFNRSDAFTFAGVISGSGGVAQSGIGTTILTASNTYTGPTAVNAGTLEVDGAITHSSGVAVNAGGTLAGVGTVDPAAVTVYPGGTFAPGSPGIPGTSMTIAGGLAFQPGALYLVQLNSTSSTFANVTGTAALAGNVLGAIATGSIPQREYTILQSAGLNGTTFAAASSSSPNFDASLSYTDNDVLLNIAAALGDGVALNGNQQNVADTLNNFFNAGGALPPDFANLFGLTGGSLTSALSQFDGEVAADRALVAFQMTTEFLNLMLDPFVDGRLGGADGAGNVSGPAMAFAPAKQATLPSDVAHAYAGVLKAPPPAFTRRWTAWGASYGGGGWINGDAAVGSNDVDAHSFGFAGGMDYHYSPDTVFGFALAGGGTGWGLSGGLGSGRSDAFQAGVYGITRSGPAYLAAALAFTNHWMTTSRTVIGDELDASFTAQSYGARLEGGYRFAALPKSGLGVTPYVALQAQDFHTPAYSESDTAGSGFALSYAAADATDTRTELGARFDETTVVGSLPLLLRARVAWAHDFVGNSAIEPVFESLPGASFTVNGAAIPQDAALTSAGAELHITPHATLIAKFDGEFAPGSQTYAGTGTLRYMW